MTNPEMQEEIEAVMNELRLEEDGVCFECGTDIRWLENLQRYRKALEEIAALRVTEGGWELAGAMQIRARKALTPAAEEALNPEGGRRPMSKGLGLSAMGSLSAPGGAIDAASRALEGGATDEAALP